jgi:hypothetical protein
MAEYDKCIHTKDQLNQFLERNLAPKTLQQLRDLLDVRDTGEQGVFLVSKSNSYNQLEVTGARESVIKFIASGQFAKEGLEVDFSSNDWEQRIDDVFQRCNEDKLLMDVEVGIFNETGLRVRGFRNDQALADDLISKGKTPEEVFRYFQENRVPSSGSPVIVGDYVLISVPEELFRHSTMSLRMMKNLGVDPLEKSAEVFSSDSWRLLEPEES